MTSAQTDRLAGNDSTGNSFAVDALPERLVADPEPECSFSQMVCIGGVYAEPEGVRVSWIARDQSGSDHVTQAYNCLSNVRNQSRGAVLAEPFSWTVAQWVILVVVILVEEYYPAFDVQWAAEGMLREELRQNHVRHDTFEGLDRTQDLAPPGNTPLNLSAA